MSSKSKMLNEGKSNDKIIQTEEMRRKKQITLILKIVMALMCLITLTLIIVFLVDMGDGEVSYFNQHFLASICLACVGVVAMILPYITKRKFSDNKGDKMMPVVGIMLIVCAIISIFMSYVDLGI